MGGYYTLKNRILPNQRGVINMESNFSPLGRPNHLTYISKLQMASCHYYFVIEMGPNPTRAYFWPAVNKRLTCLWPGYFLTWPEGKKLKNLTFLGEIFQNQTQTIYGWPDPTQTGSKIFDPDPSLLCKY